MTDCMICFSPIEKNDKVFKCGDPKCIARTCQECTIALINYSFGERLIPKCTSQHCQSYYLWSGLIGLPKEVQNQYAMCTLEYMLHDKGENVKKQVEQKKILDRLRLERKKFIEKTFPAAVALVCSITFASKIKTLERNRSKQIQEQMEASHRTCMNLYCNGHLTSEPNNDKSGDSTLKCMTCSTQFCSKCEKTLSADSIHKCQEADIESIKMIESMIHCPKCHLAVFKDVGCDSITCANCGEHFLYSTGQKGGHGSQNAKIVIRAQRQLLSHVYKDQMDHQQMELIRLIEILEPKAVSDASIYTILRTIYKQTPPKPEKPENPENPEKPENPENPENQRTKKLTFKKTKLTFKKKDITPSQPADPFNDGNLEGTEGSKLEETEGSKLEETEDKLEEIEGNQEISLENDPSTSLQVEDRITIARKIARQLDLMIRNKYQIRRFHQAMREAEMQLREKKASNRSLSRILEELENEI